MFITNPNFSIPDPGSKRFRIWIRIKIIKVFLTHKIVSKLSEIWSGMLYPVPALNFYPSRIQGSKTHRIPDPQHCHIAIEVDVGAGHLITTFQNQAKPVVRLVNHRFVRKIKILIPIKLCFGSWTRRIEGHPDLDYLYGSGSFSILPYGLRITYYRIDTFTKLRNWYKCTYSKW